ncbi:NADH-quinone oxidoreductase subunit L [Marinobacterium litorale]|uniref:NADH-quinone oxidoreductase subunit L n=1 Tax=Marinobacterium litorale TaxID=404770 RepID=UPI0003F8416F|nr:NADH-quinone oxidoreductase subunit L [Marinobacterium litorale]
MLAALVWLFPALMAIAFLLSLKASDPWQPARWAAAVGLPLVLVVTIAGSMAHLRGLHEADALGLTLTLLVALLSWVVIRFSARYLSGEPEQRRFVSAMLFTLASVVVLVTSRHLGVIVLAWGATSVGLHFLLTFYRERKTAQIVAHKKFLVSRMADACLLVALGLIYSVTGSLSLDQINAQLAGAAALPFSLHLAVVLFALAAILKSAQLPLHGWLIQVMEAPTPVSALLHAGVVNMGGFVMIRLAEMLSLAPVAQWLLVIVGSTTAVLAGLVMMTRISIKVRLAWSTCSQMGFMLMEVGLGLYELALLHLVAHSLYKAYAFLSSGDTLAQVRMQSLSAPYASKTGITATLWALVLSAALVLSSVSVWQWALGLALPPVVSLILVLGFASLLWQAVLQSVPALVRGLVQVTLLTQLYLTWHLVFAAILPAQPTTSIVLMAWVGFCFAMLYLLQAILSARPDGVLSRRLYPWVYNGFYLDETFTRLTFRFWPARLSALQARTLVNRNPSPTGEMV